MRKDFVVTCELDMCAECVEKVCVTTNLPEKAKKMAIKKFKNDGHFFVNVISCKEV